MLTSPNPLLISIVESKRLREDVRTAVIKCMFILQGSLDPQAIMAATEWELKHGSPPTWEQLVAWAKRYVDDPENARTVERLLSRHNSEMCGCSEEFREYLDSLAKEAANA